MKRTALLLIAFFTLLFSSITHAQQAERLRAVTQLFVPADSIIHLEDSTVYYYSGARATDSLWGLLQQYDSSYVYTYQGGTGYMLHQIHRATYDAGNNVMSDTAYQFDTLTASFIYYQLRIYTYSNAGMPYKIFTLYYTNNTWDTVQTSIREFDNAGHVTVELSLAGTDTTVAYYLSYTAAGLYSSTRSYSYMAGEPASYSELNLFDSLGRSDTMIIYFRYHGIGPWSTTQMTTYEYDSAGYLSYQYTYNADSAGWSIPGRAYVTYDSHHNLTQYVYQSPDSSGDWINVSRNFFAYDSYNMPTLISRYNPWDTTGGGSWGPQGDAYYLYYELYTPDTSTGIADIKSSGDLRLYPVPAADMLQLSVKWNEAQSSTATIYDATGRKYSEWQLPCTDTYNGYIPVMTLPAGMYILQVKGEYGTVTKSFDVRR